MTVQPTGRARGRARGRPRTAEELAAMRRPGETTNTPATSAQGLVPGRGRGVSGDREPARGRGVSQERTTALTSAVPAGGRAHHRGRGATRGRRDRADEFFTRTRPADLQSKRGDGGTDV